MPLALTAQRLLWALWDVCAAGKAACAVGRVCSEGCVCAARCVPAVCSGRVFADLKAVCSVGCVSAVCCVGALGGCVLRAVCLVGSLGAVRSTHSPHQSQRAQPVPNTPADRHLKGLHGGLPSLRRLPECVPGHEGFLQPSSKLAREAAMNANHLHEGSLEAFMGASPIHEGSRNPSWRRNQRAQQRDPGAAKKPAMRCSSPASRHTPIDRRPKGLHESFPSSRRLPEGVPVHDGFLQPSSKLARGLRKGFPSYGGPNRPP